jgi:hypothetical protein
LIFDKYDAMPSSENFLMHSLQSSNANYENFYHKNGNYENHYIIFGTWNNLNKKNEKNGGPCVSIGFFFKEAGLALKCGQL